MTYSNQTYTDIADLTSKLDTLLAADGWTTTRSSGTGYFSARNYSAGVHDICFAMAWEPGTQMRAGIYQWIGDAWGTGGAAPWSQTDDSGNGYAGYTDASLVTARYVPAGSTPVQFWYHSDDYYFYVILEINGGSAFRHFGAGMSTKFNDWTGGEFVFGHLQDQTNTSNAQITSALNSVALDQRLADSGALTTAELFAATVHVEGLTNQPASGKWAVCMGAQAAGNLGNDRQSTPRGRCHFLGGYGGGTFASPYSQFRGTITRALCPMWPIVQMYWNRTTDNRYGPMSQLPGIRGLNIRDFDAGDEVIIGSDTWQVFPTAVKSTADSMPTGTAQSGYQGLAYKKVV